jgi:hypothetical protein
MIRATVEMTQKVRLADIKVIYGDGILGGGKLLEEIASLCLSAWGMELFECCINDAAKIVMTMTPNGMCEFADQNNVLLTLKHDATT